MIMEIVKRFYCGNITRDKNMRRYVSKELWKGSQLGPVTSVPLKTRFQRPIYCRNWRKAITMEFHFGMQDGKGRQNTDSIVHTMCNCRITSFFIHASRWKLQTGVSFDLEFRCIFQRLQYCTITIFLLTFLVISCFWNLFFESCYSLLQTTASQLYNYAKQYYQVLRNFPQY